MLRSLALTYYCRYEIKMSQYYSHVPKIFSHKQLTSAYKRQWQCTKPFILQYHYIVTLICLTVFFSGNYESK